MFVETAPGELVEVVGIPMHEQVVGKHLTLEARNASDGDWQRMQGSKFSLPVRMFGDRCGAVRGPTAPSLL